MANLDCEKIYRKIKESSYQMVKHSYADVSDGLLTTHHFDSNFSGTTAVSLLLLGKKIICFNAGDSRAILVTETKNSIISLIKFILR